MSKVCIESRRNSPPLRKFRCCLSLEHVNMRLCDSQIVEPSLRFSLKQNSMLSKAKAKLETTERQLAAKMELQDALASRNSADADSTGTHFAGRFCQ